MRKNSTQFFVATLASVVVHVFLFVWVGTYFYSPKSSIAPPIRVRLTPRISTSTPKQNSLFEHQTPRKTTTSSHEDSSFDLKGQLEPLTPGQKGRLPDLRAESTNIGLPEQQLGYVEKSTDPRVEGYKVKRLTNGDYEFKRGTIGAIVKPNGHVEFTENSFIKEPKVDVDPTGKRMPGFGSEFKGIDDVILEAMGEDPKRAHKIKFLEETRQWRTQLAFQQKKTHHEEAFIDLRRSLETIWNHPSYELSKKRHLLFELWLEAEEPEFRWWIERFIQRQLPKGSLEQFTKEELELFIKRSNGVFNPY